MLENLNRSTLKTAAFSGGNLLVYNFSTPPPFTLSNSRRFHGLWCFDLFEKPLFLKCWQRVAVQISSIRTSNRRYISSSALPLLQCSVIIRDFFKEWKALKQTLLLVQNGELLAALFVLLWSKRGTLRAQYLILSRISCLST